jgi:predicted transcriptional regulator
MKFSELELQRKIYNLIARHSGIRHSKILEALGIETAFAESILQQMENDGLITIIHDEGDQRYYIEERKEGLRGKRISLIKKKIFDLIEQNPGLHLSKIAEMLNIRISLVEYHLQYMEKEGRISCIKEKGYKRYYSKESDVGANDKKTLSLLRQETALKIVLFLLKNPNSRHKDIAEHMDLATNALSYHLNKLVEEGIVAAPVPGEEKGYTIVNRKEIIAFLRRYQLQTVVDRFTETWDDFL